MKAILINVLLFQLGWFVCVTVGGGIAIGYTAIALMIHGKWLVKNNKEWLLILIITLIGCSWDAVLSVIGVLLFEEDVILPIWLICLWLLFATTLSHSLFWLRKHTWLAGALGALFGPFSYWLGVCFSKTTSFGYSQSESLFVMAVGWFFILPIGMLLTKRFNS